MTISLPIPFTNTNYAVIASGYDGKSLSSLNYEIRNFNRTVQSFQLWIQQTGASWLAIGY